MKTSAPPLSKLTKAYLNKYFKTRDIPHDEWEVDVNGDTHIISNKLIIDLILQASPQEQRILADALQELESSSANVNTFLKHLSFESNILRHITRH